MYALIAIIILMNNLQSLKSQLLLEYSEKEIQQWNRKNFYQHHNLPARSCVKSREGSSKLNTRPILRLSPSKLIRPSISEQKIVGRKLFQDISKVKVPGPGSYDFSLTRHSSHCYIKKEEEFIKGKIAKKLRRRQLINQCRGPGIYNPELAFNHTSKSKNHPQTRISDSYFTRCILPQARKEGLHLTSTLSQRFIRNNEMPGPQSYETNSSKIIASNMRRPVVHLMSMTERSSIIKPEMAPAPGFYKLSRQFQASPIKSGKGKIQYKFVYGHPS